MKRPASTHERLAERLARILTKLNVGYQLRAAELAAEFQVSQVIQGWTEGLQLMKVGAKYRFFIPAALAYGQIGSGDAIEPNSTLIFDVELLEIVK